MHAGKYCSTQAQITVTFVKALPHLELGPVNTGLYAHIFYQELLCTVSKIACTCLVLGAVNSNHLRFQTAFPICLKRRTTSILWFCNFVKNSKFEELVSLWLTQSSEFHLRSPVCEQSIFYKISSQKPLNEQKHSAKPCHWTQGKLGGKCICLQPI